MVAADGTILPSSGLPLSPDLEVAQTNFQKIQSGLKTEKLSEKIIKSSHKEECNVYQLPGPVAPVLQHQVQYRDRGFKSFANLKGEIVQCPHCNFKPRRIGVAGRKSDLKRHIINVHEDEGEKVQCPHCDFKPKRKYCLQQHLQAVHAEPTLQCPECDYKASMKTNIKRHIQANHAGPKFFPCSQCDFKAKSDSNLRLHVNAIHKGEIFTCPHCDYSSVQNGMVKRHILSVHIGQTFTCPHCGETRKTKRSINNHILRIHQGEVLKKKHLCDQCDFASDGLLKLKVHVKSKHRQYRNTNEMEKMFQNNYENIEQQLVDLESCDVIVSFS